MAPHALPNFIRILLDAETGLLIGLGSAWCLPESINRIISTSNHVPYREGDSIMFHLLCLMAVSEDYEGAVLSTLARLNLSSA